LAVDAVDFDVRPGEVFGFLGPSIVHVGDLSRGVLREVTFRVIPILLAAFAHNTASLKQRALPWETWVLRGFDGERGRHNILP